MDHHQPIIEAPADAAERNPDILRAEMSILTTPESAAYSSQAYAAIQNVQTQCAADVKNICSVEAMALENRLVDDAVMSRRLKEQQSGDGLKLIRSIQSLYQKNPASVNAKPNTLIRRGVHQKYSSASVQTNNKRALVEEDSKEAVRAARKEAKQAAAVSGAATPNAIAAVTAGGAGNNALAGAPTVTLTANDGRKIPSGGVGMRMQNLSPGPIVREAAPDGSRLPTEGGRGGGRNGQFNRGGRGGRGGAGRGGGGGADAGAGADSGAAAAPRRPPVSPAPVPPTDGAPTGNNGLDLEHGRINPKAPTGTQVLPPAGVGRAGRLPMNGNRGPRGPGGDPTLRYGGHNAHEAGKTPPPPPPAPAAPVAAPAVPVPPAKDAPLPVEQKAHPEGSGLFGALKSFFVPAAKAPAAPRPPPPANTIGQDEAALKPKPVPGAAPAGGAPLSKPAPPVRITPAHMDPPSDAAAAPLPAVAATDAAAAVAAAPAPAVGVIAPAVVPSGGHNKAIAASSPAGVIDANAVPVIPAAAPRSPGMGMKGHDHAQMLRDQAAAAAAAAAAPGDAAAARPAGKATQQTPVVAATANGPVFVAAAGATPVNPRAHHVLAPTTAAAPAAAVPEVATIANTAGAGTTPGAVAAADADMAIRPANEQGGIRLRGGHKRPNGGGATVQEHRRAFGDHHWGPHDHHDGHHSDSDSDSESEGDRKQRPSPPRKGCDPRKGQPRHLTASHRRGGVQRLLDSHDHHHEHPHDGWDSDEEPCDPHVPVDGPPVDPLYSGALGFGSDGDLCVYQHMDALSQPCNEAISDLYAVRAQYAEQSTHHCGGVALLILGALAVFCGVRRCMRRGHFKKVRTFMNAVRGNEHLKGIIEAETGLTVPEPPKRVCGGRFRQFCCNFRRVLVVLLVGLVGLHFALHIAGHIVQGVDERDLAEGGQGASPVFAIGVLLSVLLAEVAVAWGVCRAVKLVRQRYFGIGGDSQQPTVVPSAPAAAHEGYSALPGDEQGTEMTTRGVAAAVYAPVVVRMV